MAAKGFVLQTADVELAANDGAQQIFIIRVRRDLPTAMYYFESPLSRVGPQFEA
jgi:hypothetical protein